MIQNYKIKNQQKKIEEYLNQTCKKAYLKKPSIEANGNKKNKKHVKELINITDKYI